MPVRTFEFKDHRLKLLDQRKLPCVETWVECGNARKVYWAIQNMVVRGAPAIGVAGGYGLYLGIAAWRGDRKCFLKELHRVAEYLKSSRPTGVNLRNVIDAIVARIEKKKETDVNSLKRFVLEEARKAHREDDQICRAIGRYGAKLFKNGEGVLTHCNAGGLATSGYGTALGVIYGCQEKGKTLDVYADETRPLLQGARLTAWELKKSGIKATVICDNMAASLMRSGKIDRIVVGADRIAANGDTANKIGTYNLAVLARVHKIPFYIAAPSTTFDFKITSGKQIPIEERHGEEITDGFGRKTVPLGVKVWNPAFDVTPHAYIAAFITEAGVLRPPFSRSFKKLKAGLEMS
ncbi:MAG: S-methyl-5-thioribose-1-phosphate isomerase [Candidatus Omnitrophica bacterium]|nr:S-methyl-5-thioribose-1-phosphate isomerase [Candidatus Omnitrophota bacterium]MDD5671416.1 S-methyl-5-thioribose-1-phosphate isomerase [Candidatus Omnitrophota bacterium]